MGADSLSFLLGGGLGGLLLDVGVALACAGFAWSRYNGALRPAVVSVRNGQANLMLRRETVDDLLALEVN